MSMIKSTKRLGFTIIEFLIAIILLAILSGVLMFSFSAMIDKSKATTCLANRKTIQKAYNLYSLGKTNPKSLYDFILDNKDGIADDWLYTSINCPSKGDYTASKDIVICSIHNPLKLPDDDPGSPPDDNPDYEIPDNMIPGTNIGGGTGIIATDDWDKDCVEKKLVGWRLKVEAGSIFYKSGKFYVATEAIDRDHVVLDPILEIANSRPWGGGIVQVTEKVVNWDDPDRGNLFQRGDIIYQNGNYYVSKTKIGDKINLIVTGSPIEDTKNWQILKNKP